MAKESLKIILDDIEDGWPSISTFSNAIPWELLVEDGTVTDDEVNILLKKQSPTYSVCYILSLTR